MILTLGALVTLHGRWLWRRALGRSCRRRSCSPPESRPSGSGSARGVWRRSGPGDDRGASAMCGGQAQRAGAACGGRGRRAQSIVCALSTWVNLAGSLNVARTSPRRATRATCPRRCARCRRWDVAGRAATSRPARRHLIAVLRDRGTHADRGRAGGMLRIVYMGEYALAGWIGLIVWRPDRADRVYDGVGERQDVRAQLTRCSCCWRGVGSPGCASRRGACATAGAAAGDRAAGARARWRNRECQTRLQYHASDLAPTARYEELAVDEQAVRRQRARCCLPTSTNTRCMSCATSTSAAWTSSIRRSGCARRRATDPRSTWTTCRRLRWGAYPLIVTPRDPTVSDPPSAYRPVWQGDVLPGVAAPPGRPCWRSPISACRTRGGPCASVATHGADRRTPTGVHCRRGPPETVMVDVPTLSTPRPGRTPIPGLEMTGAGR